MAAETYRAPIRQAYSHAEESNTAYRHAQQLVQATRQAHPTDPVLLAYAHALDGVGALYCTSPMEQFTRTLQAQKALGTLDYAEHDLPTAFELRLIRASYGRGLPPVFMSDGWVRQEVKQLLRMLENHGKELPHELVKLCITFLNRKMTLGFLDADRLKAIEQLLH